MVPTKFTTTMKAVTPTGTKIVLIIIVTVIVTIMDDAPILLINPSGLMMIDHHRT